MQIRGAPAAWPKDSLDMLLFIAAYSNLSMDMHSFLGNDEFAAILCFAIYWAAVAESERRLLLENGFYGRLNAYFTQTGFMSRRRAPIRVANVEYASFAYDAFQRPRLSLLIPRGLGVLFYGAPTIRLYRGDLPMNGRMAVVPRNGEDGAVMLARLAADRAAVVALR
ncbi:unnamed protein product [Oikopleura dioica]|uniref:Uncharacterized protein n=1 Tax=Oikopleura dioica TaxID=34765 RepID=E4XSL1_OIKDI|nr:unnamed protein product [Oikopleura dioica]